MHTIKISFEEIENKNFDDVNQSVSLLIGVWRMNGQIVGKEFPVARTKKGMEIYVDAPNADSLSKKFNNKYVSKYLSEIKEKGLTPKITVLGKEPESAMLCECEKIKSFILFTTYVSSESSLKCFECFGVVPLYKIPKTADDEYYDIISWQTNYQSCDTLQMNCAVGERFATNQLSKLDSQLTKQELKVCETIEKVTGKKVFYYLYRYNAKSYQNELSRKCPKCGGSWYLKKPLHNKFDFMCKKCRLLSNIAWDVR